MKKRVLLAMVSTLFALSMVGVALAQDKVAAGSPPVVKEMVAKAKGSIQKVSAADVKAAIDKKENAVLLEVYELILHFIQHVALREQSLDFPMATTVSVLLGGFLLRYVVVYAGQVPQVIST